MRDSLLGVIYACSQALSFKKMRNIFKLMRKGEQLLREKSGSSEIRILVLSQGMIIEV
jgi:hypothetical protein